MSSPAIPLSLPRRTNPREQRYQQWLVEFRKFLKAKRGRSSELAKFLCCRRQNAHRWFVGLHTAIPAWAAVYANVWYQKAKGLVPSQADGK